jgi:hypothetical protein
MGPTTSRRCSWLTSTQHRRSHRGKRHHIEPQEKNMRVRNRIDGVLHEMTSSR